MKITCFLLLYLYEEKEAPLCLLTLNQHLKNAKPQLLITLIYALIAFAVIAVVYLLANFQLAKYAQTIAIYSQFGQKPPVDAYLKSYRCITYSSCSFTVCFSSNFYRNYKCYETSNES